MTGKIIALMMGATAVICAVALYYLQVFHYYERPEPEGFVVETPDGPMEVGARNIRAIDASSSPIRFRACFDAAEMPPNATPYPEAVPLTAPFWFDCFDAEEIGVALERGEAQAYLAERNIEYGADRVVAITPDGRGYVWQQLNNCGELAYDGTPVTEACPPREEFE